MKKLPLVLALILVVSGCASSASSPSPASPTSSPDQTPVEVEQRTAEPEVNAEDTTCNIDEKFGKCFYGQTAIYKDSRRSGDQVLLEITVQEPREFKPGSDARFATKTLGGTQEQGADNLYFDISIRNLSEKAILGRSDVELAANSATDGDSHVRTVQDDKVKAYWDAILQPGQSSTMRSGWNFNNGTKPTFKVRIDGLGGNSVTFSHK